MEMINNDIQNNDIQNNEQKPHILTTQDLLMHSVSQFFRVRKNLEVMLPIIQGKSIISLRVIDWFVTNYSKKNNIFYNLKGKDGSISPFFVFLDYKQQLKGYSKKIIKERYYSKGYLSPEEIKKLMKK